jgi:hypothetical protein
MSEARPGEGRLLHHHCPHPALRATFSRKREKGTSTLLRRPNHLHCCPCLLELQRFNPPRALANLLG